jgi:AraC family transcriptional regulator, regulatory protein of adaptative response / methylated-DNA-[protein]-cysteine methyltransferase
MELIPVTYNQLADDYQRIEQAIHYLEEHFLEQPDLQKAADSVGLSEFHFQRIFTRWVGISPKRFLQFLTKEHAKELLRRRADLLETAYASGLSSPGRLHDLFVACEAVTPGEFKNHGAGLTIIYGFHPTPFGECLLASTARGICGLAFVQPGLQAAALQELRTRWRSAVVQEDPAVTAHFIPQIFQATGAAGVPLPILLNGTNFQIKVWEALLRIPSGSVVTYEDIARSIGMPSAARAVSNAVASNPVALVIPCHRVIRKDGEFGGYHYGTARKKAILGWEMAQQLSA